MHKIILSGILSFPIVTCAFTALHNYHKLPVYVSAPAVISFQVLSLVGGSLMVDDQ